MQVFILTTTVVDTDCYAEGADVNVMAYGTFERAVEAGLSWYVDFTGDDDEVQFELADIERDLKRDSSVDIERGRYDLTITVSQRAVK